MVAEAEDACCSSAAGDTSLTFAFSQSSPLQASISQQARIYKSLAGLQMELLDDALKQAELQKLQSEISRNVAEENKLLGETREIERRLSKGVFRSESMAKAVVGGIVAAALLTAWSIQYLQPLLSGKQELATLENQILAAENKSREREIRLARLALDSAERNAQNDRIVLESRNDSLMNQESVAKKLAEDLRARYDNLAKEYQELARENTLTETEKRKFAVLANGALKDSRHLQVVIDGLLASPNSTGVGLSGTAERMFTDWLEGDSGVWNYQSNSKHNVKLVLRFSRNGRLRVNGIEGHGAWRVSQGILALTINHGADSLAARVSDPHPSRIDGTARNVKGDTWNWVITRASH